MIYRTVTLAPYEGATLTAICVSNTPELKQPPRRAVVVCPGGGYNMLSDREAEPIATQFLAAGFATFILRYTVGDGAANFAPLCQVALAIRHVREHAAEYNVDPDYVFTCGFSAGGHLAASAGILTDHPAVQKLMADAPADIARPTGMILAYPVITAGEKAHHGSIHKLCGTKTPTKEEEDRFSLELHVSDKTPPAFIWHTFSDEAVPVENSLYLAQVMSEHHIPVEMQQRVAIARTLAMNTEILLMDEPFGAIDAKNRLSLQELVSDIYKTEKKTVVFVTHDVDEALLLADRIIFMQPKKILQDIKVDFERPHDRDKLFQNPDYIGLRKVLQNTIKKK